jgi:hypothetical protein
MRHLRVLTSFLALMAVQGATSAAWAQVSFDEWLRQRATGLAQRRMADEQMDRQKSTEAPSVANGTALVDQTESPDLLGLSMSLYNATNDDEDNTPVTVTVSGWSLRNTLTHEDPLDPAVYLRGANWRRWSFTVGRELEAGAAAARVFGAKALIWNGRDVAASAHVRSLDNLNTQFPEFAKGLADVRGRVIDFLFTRLSGRVALKDTSAAQQKAEFLNDRLGNAEFMSTVEKLTESELAELDGILIDRAVIDAQLQATVQQAVRAIRGAPQLAVTYHAKLRDERGADEHRWQAVFDYGPTDRLEVSVNGSVDLRRPSGLEDERAGRLAGELTWAPGRTSAADRARELMSDRPRRPSPSITLGVSGEYEWRADKSGTGKVQGKLMLPIPALNGVALPISVTYANDPELIDEHDVRGQVGFTLDFSQLKRALDR